MAILAGKLVLQLALLKAGFFVVSGDDYLRALIAEEWANDPFFVPNDFGRASILWLPAPFWFSGIFHALIGDVWLAPIIANLIFGLGGVAAIYVLTQRLSGATEAALAAIFVAILPWHSWMSLSALADPPYQVGVITAMIALIVWEKSKRANHRWLFGSAGALFFACMCRPEAWLFASAFAAYYALLFLRVKQLRMVLAVAAIIPFLFVFYWLIHNYQLHGNPTEFVDEARSSMSRETEKGDSIFGRIALFPILLVLVSPILTIISCYWTAKRLYKRELCPSPLLVYIGIVALAFLLLIGGFAAGMGTNTTPQRFVVIFAMLLIPVATSALLKHRKRVLTLGVFGIAVLWSLLGVFRFPDDFRAEAELGRAVRSLIQEGDIVLTEDNFLASHQISPPNMFERIRSQCRDWAVKAMSNQPAAFPLNVREDCVWNAETVTEKSRSALERGDVRIILARKTQTLDLLPDNFVYESSAGGYGIFVKSEGLVGVNSNPVPIEDKPKLGSFEIDNAIFAKFVDINWSVQTKSSQSIKLVF
ncbi:MAG: glycosyltransferase family 39 protein, partial [Verrucomicrobiota bacterium]